ncbi:MAG: hypothetical protein E6H07_17460 [Bacteroidetes bacterium]|nr:MAG: hypothetical protein E6H07_17460 [Bacteroidota bacterium]
MNKKMKWIGVIAAILLIVSCFTPWVIIESKAITVSGIDATGTNYGKPGYFHFIFAFFFLLLSFIQKLWAKRFNLLVVAINVAWAAKNYFLLTACAGGECPVSQIGLWLMLFASGVMLISSFFPDIEIKQEQKS